MRPEKDTSKEELLYSQNEQDRKIRILSRFMQPKDKMKNDHIGTADNEPSPPKNMIRISYSNFVKIVVILSISLSINLPLVGIISTAVALAKFDPAKFNITFDNICIFGTCIQTYVPEGTPVPVGPSEVSGDPPSLMNPVDCTRPSLPPVQNDHMRITVNSIDVKKTHINLNSLYLTLTVENLTNSDLKLDLHQNLRILQSEPLFVIAAPDVNFSSWQPVVPPLSKLDQTIKISQISDNITSINMEFLNTIVDGRVQPGISVMGIPSSCSS